MERDKDEYSNSKALGAFMEEEEELVEEKQTKKRKSADKKQENAPGKKQKLVEDPGPEYDGVGPDDSLDDPGEADEVEEDDYTRGFSEDTTDAKKLQVLKTTLHGYRDYLGKKLQPFAKELTWDAVEALPDLESALNLESRIIQYRNQGTGVPFVVNTTYQAGYLLEVGSIFAYGKGLIPTHLGGLGKQLASEPVTETLIEATLYHRMAYSVTPYKRFVGVLTQVLGSVAWNNFQDPEKNGGPLLESMRAAEHLAGKDNSQYLNTEKEIQGLENKV